MSKLIAREQSGWIVTSDYPDVCKTPMGSSVVSVPYPVVAKLTSSISVVKTVNANSNPLFVYDQSSVTTTLGDQAGIAKGVKSGKVGGYCFPDEHSQTVKANGKLIIRHEDKFWMNG